MSADQQAAVAEAVARAEQARQAAAAALEAQRRTQQQIAEFNAMTGARP